MTVIWVAYWASLRWVQLEYSQRKQWDPSNIKIADDDDDESSGEESEEHDSDVVHIYTSSDDNDDDQDDPLKEPVLHAGDLYDSFEPADLSDVSVPSDNKKGKKEFLSECTLDAYDKRTNWIIMNIHCDSSGPNTKSSVGR